MSAGGDDYPHRPIADVLLVAAATVGFSAILELTGAPTPVLFGSLLAGVTHSLTRPTELHLPPATFRVGQALLGVTIGALVPVAALVDLGGQLVPILVVTVVTVGISLIAGWILTRTADVNLVTSTFSMIAGGASGVVAMAHDLGADEVVVTVVQYLRVLLILVTLPFVAALAFSPPHGMGVFESRSGPVATSLAFVAVALGVGLVFARLLDATSSALLVPLAVTVALGSTSWFAEAGIPVPVEWLAYGIVGAQVGLRFRPEKLRLIARLLPTVLVVMTAMVAATAAAGAVLAAATPVDGLTAYLATTPGGFFAVLAIAADSGSDVTYVMATQILRLLVVLALVPLLARLLRSR